MAIPGVAPEQLIGFTRRSPFFLIALVAGFFFIFNGSALFGESWTDRWEFYTLVYVLMVVTGTLFTLDIAGKTTILGTVGGFAAGFGASAIILGIALGGRTVPLYPVGALGAVLAYQIFVVAYSEEVFFRQFLASKMGILPSALFFAVFHYGAYVVLAGAFSPLMLVTPAIFGVSLGWIYVAASERISPGFAIGVVWGLHASWNLTILLGPLFLLLIAVF